MSRVPLSLLLLAFVLVVFAGCKESCPICETYVKAVKECVKENPPTQQALEEQSKLCLKACAEKEATQDKEKRREISERFMAPQACVLEYEGNGCDAFVKCLDGLKK